MKITVTTYDYDADAEEIDHSTAHISEDITDLAALQDALEVSDGRIEEIRKVLENGKEYMLFDDEGSFVCTDYVSVIKMGSN